MSARAIAYRRGRLFIEDVPAERIAEAVGTPTYVYSALEILCRYRAFEEAFIAREHLLCYALKANPNRAICRLLAREGAGADIVSVGELKRALGAGVPPDRIVFSGVGKTDEELGAALRAGILAVNVESSEEAQRLESMARRLGRRAPFAVRLNPDVDGGTHAHVTTGRAGTKFGVPMAEAAAIYRRARGGSRLDAVGVQCHIGSQITKTGPYRAAMKTLLAIVDAAAGMGLRLQYADIGGGMGIVYDRAIPRGSAASEAMVAADKGRDLAPRRLAEVLLPALKFRPGLKLLLEPGRCLVGPAGVLLTRMLYRKEGGKKRFVVVDAAMNDLIRPALYGARHPIVPVRPRKGALRAADVVGPVCESADFLAKGRRLPPLEPGDALAVLQAGAYGFSMSSQYNSRPRAAEVLVEGSSFRVVRNRETFADIVRHEKA
ncbi:MAG: diaminopimelate decarboxylase [Elusimicrobia bacterium]|nr:diaminopimelate decarboxylase [Elusimicrobiota bacterium]